MQTNTAHASEINLNVENYTPKRPIILGTLHLSSFSSKTQKCISSSECKLNAGEQFVCNTATD